MCDEKIDWFLEYLILNKVRTFLPFQAEIICSGPEKVAGVRLKELMIKKANETLNSPKNNHNKPNLQQNLLDSLIPGMIQGVHLKPTLEGSSRGSATMAQNVDEVSFFLNTPESDYFFLK